MIVSTYQRLQNIAKTAKELECDSGHISKILKEKGIKVLSTQEVMTKGHGQEVEQYDLEGNFIQSFPSFAAAGRFLKKTRSSQHIQECAIGKRKTAYGYVWKIAE